MKHLKEDILRKFVTVVLTASALLVAGCTSVSRIASAVATLGSNDGLQVTVEALPGNAAIYRSGQAIRVLVSDPKDSRPAAIMRRLGHIRTTVVDMHSTELMLNQSVSTLVGSALRNQLVADGYISVSAGQTYDVELSTRVNEFELNIAGRDELTLTLEASLRDGRTNEVIWTGIVGEKSDRFAGVAGNSRATISRYLGDGVANLVQKVSAGVRVALSQSYPKTVSAQSHTANVISIPGVSTLKSVIVNESLDAVPVVPVKRGASAPVPQTPIAPAETAAKTGARPTLALDGLPGYGYFSVISMPTRVKVYSDGVYYGLTPLRVMVPAGVITFEFRFDGYKTLKEKVLVRAGDTTELELKLKK